MTKTTKAIFIILGAYAAFALSDASAKLLLQKYSPYLLLLIGSLIGLPFFIFLAFCQKKLPELRYQKIHRHIIRGGLKLISAFCAFKGFALLPLAEAYAIIFTAPLLTILIAPIWLKEQVTKPRLVAVLIGFSAILLIIWPDIERAQNDVSAMDRLEGYVYVFGTALFFALQNLYIRAQGEKETPLSYAFNGLWLVYLPVLLTLFSGQYFDIIEQTLFTRPALNDLPLFLWMGVWGNLGLFGVITAYHMAPASLLGSYHYTQIIWGGLAGYLLFHDIPTSETLKGITIIISSGLVLAFQEHRHETQKNL